MSESIPIDVVYLDCLAKDEDWYGILVYWKEHYDSIRRIVDKVDKESSIRNLQKEVAHRYGFAEDKWPEGAYGDDAWEQYLTIRKHAESLGHAERGRFFKEHGIKIG